MSQLVLFGVLVIALNILDSISTHACLKASGNDISKEANVLMRSLFEGDFLLANIVKHLLVTIYVVYEIYAGNSENLLMMVILFGIVVINNGVSFILIKKKNKGNVSLNKLFKKMPSWLSYLIILSILIIVSKVISKAIVGS
jgi:hypothetical protein